MLGILGILPGWLQWGLMAALAAAAAAVVYSYNSALRSNEKLRAEVSRLEVNIDRMKSVENTLRANLKLKEAALEAGDEHAAAFGANLKEACELWEKVKDSETPVDDVLEGLKERENEN